MPLLPFLLAFLLWASPAAAQIAPGQVPQAATITSSHGTVIPSNTGLPYKIAELFNQSASLFVYCLWGGTSVASAAAGQFTLAPLSGYIWNETDPPPAGTVLDCVCSGASCPATARAF
jgi:hypothetical protein